MSDAENPVEKELKKLTEYEHSHITMSIKGEDRIILRQIHDGEKRKGTDEIWLDPKEWKELTSVDLSELVKDDDGKA